MSESKPRSFDEIQNEYQGLCTKVGHMSYQVWALNKEINTINDRIRDINFEAAALKEAEKAAEEPKKEA